MKNESLIDPQTLIQTLSPEELCLTAEQYYQSITDPTPQMAQPFSSFFEGPLLLQNIGVLLSGLKLSKTMTVLDFGAGTCWLSRFLNQLQCQTISCDPSETALALGKRLFDEYPIVGSMVAEPRFLHFDGYTIDLPDNSVDRIISFSTFHHVPNQADILAEFGRILKDGGIAGFSEPGRHHSQHPQSQWEMRNYNVLENDIILEDILQMAREYGFTDMTCKVIANYDVPLKQYLGLSNNRWNLLLDGKLKRHVQNTITNQSIFFLHKGHYLPDSRGHAGLSHEIQLHETEYAVAKGEKFTVDLKIKNTGQAKWLSENITDVGVVKVGTHLYDHDDQLLELDFTRHLFDEPVEPGEILQQEISISIPDSGIFKLVIDLVSEGICWFEQIGASPQEVIVTVAAE